MKFYMWILILVYICPVFNELRFKTLGRINLFLDFNQSSDLYSKKSCSDLLGATSQQCKASVWSTHLLIRVSSVSQKRTKEAMFLLFLGREDAVQRFLSFANMKHPTTKLRDCRLGVGTSPPCLLAFANRSRPRIPCPSTQHLICSPFKKTSIVFQLNPVRPIKFI
jgi:hypothetical protein